MKMVNQDMSTPTHDSTNNADEGNVIDVSIEKLRSGSARSARSSSNGDEEDTRNASKRSTSSFSSFTTFALSGMWHRKDPAPNAPAKKSSKKWKNSKRGRKFSFSSTEEYMEYAARKSFAREQQAAKKQPEKPEESTDKKSRSKTSKNRKNYRQGRKFSFSSSQEYLEYVASKKEDENFKRATKRNTQSTEFAKSTEFAESIEFEALDATADVTIVGTVGDMVDYEAQEIRDVESSSISDYSDSNNYSNAESEGEKKRCLHRKLTFSDVWRILLLWAIVVVLAVVLSRKTFFNSDAITTPLATNSTACSLCPSGSSVHEPELEVLLGDFTCALEEPLTPKAYTCGEVEKLLSESASCGNNEEEEEEGSCSELQEAANQCCSPDPDEILDEEAEEIFEEQIAQSERGVGHLGN